MDGIYPFVFEDTDGKSNGKHEPMSTEQLRSWYGRFGFRGSSPFKREPAEI